MTEFPKSSWAMRSSESRGRLLGIVIAGLQLLAASSGAAGADKITPATNAEITLNRLSGAFTVTSLEVVNGVSHANGYFTAEAIDGTGAWLEILKDIPVTLPIPLNGKLAGRA